VQDQDSVKYKQASLIKENLPLPGECLVMGGI
jgi:hypothetical protein